MFSGSPKSGKIENYVLCVSAKTKANGGSVGWQRFELVPVCAEWTNLEWSKRMAKANEHNSSRSVILILSLFKLYHVRRRRQLGRLLWSQVFGQPNKNKTEYSRFEATTTTAQMARVQLMSRLCSCHSARTHSPTTFNSLNVYRTECQIEKRRFFISTLDCFFSRHSSLPSHFCFEHSRSATLEFQLRFILAPSIANAIWQVAHRAFPERT